MKFKQNLENSRPKSFKIQFFKGEKDEKNDESANIGLYFYFFFNKFFFCREDARNKMLEKLKEVKKRKI